MKLKCSMVKTGKEMKELMKKIEMMDDDQVYKITFKCQTVEGLFKGKTQKTGAQETRRLLFSFYILRSFSSHCNTLQVGDITGNCVEERSIYFERMKVIEQAAIETDPYLASYILKAVTEGHPYNYLKTRLEIPCSRDTYYDRYRRFFWLLDQTRK